MILVYALKNYRMEIWHKPKASTAIEFFHMCSGHSVSRETQIECSDAVLEETHIVEVALHDTGPRSVLQLPRVDAQARPNFSYHEWMVCEINAGTPFKKARGVRLCLGEGKP
jgi:hypothetical protein